MLKLKMEGTEPQKLSRATLRPRLPTYVSGYIFFLSGTLSLRIKKFPRPHSNSLRIQIECDSAHVSGFTLVPRTLLGILAT